jgi:hypothetical protein
VVVFFNLPLLHFYLARPAAKVTATVPWRDDFSDGAKLEANYFSTGGLWRVRQGALVSPGVKNNPLWLQAVVPNDVAIDVDVKGLTSEGDARLELAGDGVTGGSGYQFVHGNAGSAFGRLGIVGTPTLDARLAEARAKGATVSTLDELARQGLFRDNQGLKIDLRFPALGVNRTVHERVERVGAELRWYVDGVEVVRFVDPFPLGGKGFDRVGLSGWEGTLEFDNFAVTPITSFTGAPTAAPVAKPAGPFADDFNRGSLGEHWHSLALGQTSLVEGALHFSQLRNRPIWLDTPLPHNARISFRARTLSPEGDVKIEAWGDGHSGYTGDPRLAYTATGYVFIAGGWRNTISVIARQHEHTPDRVERNDFHLEPGRWYRWVIERRDGHLTWSLDGQPFLEMNDAQQLRGADNHFFGFSGWDTTVEFDDLAIEAL